MQKYIVEVHDNGDRFWKNERGRFHREDGPALEGITGSKEWFINGERHREDGPAVDLPNGYKSWYINGLLHREDGPAIEYDGRYKMWYLFGRKYTEEEFNLQMNSYHGKVVEIDGKRYQLKEI